MNLHNKKYKYRDVLKPFAILLLLIISLLANAGAKPTSQIVIIIDDVGGKTSDAKAFELSKYVTFAILPHTRFSTEYSYKAAQQNREVMLHMPMESLNNEALGVGPLLSDMYPQQIQQSLLAALATVPHAVGVNNHMGSKLTQMTLPMQSMMEILAQNNMFFVDSRTTRFSKAKVIAKDFGVTTASRHIFLDHEQETAFLQRQFDRLIYQARRNGKAIGIGHPHAVTLEFLPEALASLPADIELITVSQYLEETDKFRINPQLAETNAISLLQSKTQQSAPD
jgi:polysaccharide deacetylase 2 family uncharacterized protein YibQ